MLLIIIHSWLEMTVWAVVGLITIEFLLFLVLCLARAGRHIYIVSLLYLWALRVFNQLQMKNTQKKISESSKKQNLNLLHTGSYLHSI